MSGLITVDEARARLLGRLAPLPSETLAYNQALGRTLAAPLLAQRTQPPFAASAMDGYAVRAADLSNAPATLTLAGESAAGRRHDAPVEAGTAIRISTGAPVPEGADQVVIQENVERSGDQLVMHDTPRPWANIRVPGTDFSEGHELAPAGLRLNPDAIALAAGAGVTELTVHRTPRVGVLATGNELVEPGEDTGPDQIINSVSKGVAGLVEAWGGAPVDLGIARDDPDDVRGKFAAADGLDLVVTIGGASVGDHDHLRRVFAEQAGDLAFEKIAVKPGKPTWFGRLRGTHYLGLPGNPVSALVVARLFLRPALGALCGRAEPVVFTQAQLGSALPANGPRETYVRAVRDPKTGLIVELRNQDSSALSALVRADALIRRPIDAVAAAPGDWVEILPV